MTLPGNLAEDLGQCCASSVTTARSVGGGDINDAYAVGLADGRTLFVKTRRGAPASEFATEAAGLRWLAEPAALAVADVVAHGTDAMSPPGWLALDWLTPGRLDAEGERALGEGLAGVHGAGATAFGAPPPGAPQQDGLPAPMRIGPLILENTPEPDWATFYARHRVLPVLARARDGAALSAGAARDIELVCERMAELAGPPEPPARVHGDLWTGNVLADEDGRPWLIDPAAHGGHREVDLAMLALFGSSALMVNVLAGYQQVAPLADGHAERVGLWQLFPLLVHAALFGGGYGHSAHAAARRYVA